MAGDRRPGVRGPRGPQDRGRTGSGNSGRGSTPASGSGGQPPMTAFQRASLPFLLFLTRLPRWLTVVVLSVLLVLGIIQTGSLAWLGALILTVLALFFAWLLALSWPRISPSGRLLRGLVVAALLMAAAFKLLGRF